MAEEHRCQAPRLCANNCGFFGSPATQNLCSKCYCDLQLKEQQKLALNQTLASSSLTSTPSSTALVPTSSPAVDLPEASGTQAAAIDVKKEEKVQAAIDVKKEEKVQPNRCLTCRKRVGLTGFKCRCGSVFCGSHRYPEHHDCSFDFKSMGKEQIAKANPVIKAEKLDRI